MPRTRPAHPLEFRIEAVRLLRLGWPGWSIRTGPAPRSGASYTQAETLDELRAAVQDARPLPLRRRGVLE